MYCGARRRGLDRFTIPYLHADGVQDLLRLGDPGWRPQSRASPRAVNWQAYRPESTVCTALMCQPCPRTVSGMSPVCTEDSLHTRAAVEAASRVLVLLKACPRSSAPRIKPLAGLTWPLSEPVPIA